MKLDLHFYARPTLVVAPELLGKFLVFHSPAGVVSGEINEVEAYLGESDPASHAYRGQTFRTRAMFGQAGVAYVYFIYGMYFCMNVVTETTGKAGAVLLRSVLPSEGIEIMKRNRGIASSKQLKEKELLNLTNGPGKLCQAFGITAQQYGVSLVTSHQLYIEDRGQQIRSYQTSPRIGIQKAKEQMWRFYY